jgi:hypothetical protein
MDFERAPEGRHNWWSKCAAPPGLLSADAAPPTTSVVGHGVSSLRDLSRRPILLGKGLAFFLIQKQGEIPRSARFTVIVHRERNDKI